MPPAIAAAGITAAASIGSGLMASKAQKSAANTAANAQLQATRESNALAEKIYNLNTENLSPFMDRGNDAGDTINALLGLAGPGGRASAQKARSAFNAFRQSTPYDFQVKEATRGVNQGFAGMGALQSGAAMKALSDRRQEMAKGSIFDYMGLLGNQQGVGLSGASALAGVGQNYANGVSSNNMLNANVAGNAALARGNATAGMWGNIAGGIGGLASAFGSSYGGGGFTAPQSGSYNGIPTYNFNGLSHFPTQISFG